VEALKHLLGFCGEPHGLAYTILSLGGLSAMYRYLKLKITSKG